MNQNQKINKLNRCAFCRYYTGSSCMVTPNSYYCREANDEHHQYASDYAKGVKSKAPVKSFRKWDK